MDTQTLLVIVVKVVKEVDPPYIKLDGWAVPPTPLTLVKKGTLRPFMVLLWLRRAVPPLRVPPLNGWWSVPVVL